MDALVIHKREEFVEGMVPNWTIALLKDAAAYPFV